VIRDMNVRGAPLIAIVAVLALGLEATVKKEDFKTAEEALVRMIAWSLPTQGV
jgi:methylthioribose-1-phosphate isomerase